MGLVTRLTRAPPPRWSLMSPVACQLVPQSRAASLSAIHRGMNRSNKAQGDPSPSPGYGGKRGKDASFRIVKEERNMKQKGSHKEPSRNNPWVTKKDNLKGEISQLRSALRNTQRNPRTSGPLDESKFEQAFWKDSGRGQNYPDRDGGDKGPPRRYEDGNRPPSRENRMDFAERRQRSQANVTSDFIPASPSRRSYDGEDASRRGDRAGFGDHRQGPQHGGRDLVPVYQSRRGNEFGDSAPRSKGQRYGDRDRPPREYRHNHSDRDGSVQSRRYNAPASIPHTTAASQFLYGQSVVVEALRSKRRKLYKLYIYRGGNRRDGKLESDNKMTALAESAGVPIVTISEEEQRLMDRMALGRPHNGFILEASPLPMMPIKYLRKIFTKAGRPVFMVRPHPQSKEEAEINGTADEFGYKSVNGKKPLMVLVDGVKDEGNLGSIIRSASFLGVEAVIMSTRATAKLSSVALKASAGAAESMKLFSTPDAANFVEFSRGKGWKVYASAPPASNEGGRIGMNVYDFERNEDPLIKHPCILVVGSEGEGLPAAVRAHADTELFIPDELSQNPSVESLNVGVAAGILIGSFMKPRVRSSKSVQVF